jgi:predicted MFS family arabinose efflux permease
MIAGAQVRSFRSTSAIVLAGFCAFASFYTTQPMLPMLARIFGTSAFGASLTVTAATAGVALSAPFAGAVADRVGRKRVIVSAAACVAVSTLLAATSNSLFSLIAWRFAAGVFTPGIFAITVAYIHDEWPVEAAGQATAAYVTGTIVGGFSGRMISGFVANHFRWQMVFVVVGLINCMGTVALAAWLPKERGFKPGRHDRFWTAAGNHLRNPLLVATYAVGFCVFFSLVSTFTYATFYLAAPPFHLGTAALGSIFFVYLIGAVITPAAGRAIDRWGHRNALAVAVAAGSGGVLMTLAPRLPFVIAGLAICCTGVFIAQACASSFIGIAARGNRALAVGLYVTCYYAGGSAGGALPGLAWSRAGWPACVAMIVAVQILTVALALRLWADTPAHGDLDEGALAS